MALAAVGQICSTASMSLNLAQCQNLIRKAVAAGAKALFLPEASDYIASSPAESLALCRPVTTSPFVLGLQKLARDHRLPINVGIHEPTIPPSDRLRNTLIWIDGKGDIVHRYQKLHLFDVDLRDTGGPLLEESNSTEPGPCIEAPFDDVAGMGKVGSLICFDMRFAEPSLHLRGLGADIILFPSAFTVPTGKLHWDILLRARAIETQCWVIAAAQCGRHNGKRVSYGGSIVVNPRGQVVGRLENVEDITAEGIPGDDGGTKWAREEELLLVEIDLDINKEVKKGMPLQRRTDVYPEI